MAQSNSLVLGQIKTEEKSNEITAIPELLNLLAIEGCLVTIDAMGCQKKIVETIVDREADYLIALKENQPNLYASVISHFDQVNQRRGKNQRLISLKPWKPRMVEKKKDAVEYLMMWRKLKIRNNAKS